MGDRVQCVQEGIAKRLPSYDSGRTGQYVTMPCFKSKGDVSVQRKRMNERGHGAVAVDFIPFAAKMHESRRRGHG